jgi:type IV pilus assembly protein PilC
MKSLGGFFLRVSVKEQILFARNISLMSKSGMPILDSLHMVQRQTSSGGMRKILASVITDVENGQFLSTSLKKYERVFGSLFVNIIRIGEASGTLSENLGFLADELKKKQQLRSKIMSAMMYPVIILLTTIGLTSVLMFLVFPKIMPIFTSFNIDLPLPTRILVATNKFFVNNWFWVILAGIVIVGIFVMLMKIKQFRFAMHTILIRLPLVGAMIRSVHMAIMARTFALLLKSGVKIVEALSITSEVLPNLVYKKVLSEAGEQVKAGAPLGKYLASFPHTFPIMFSQMVEVSETAGTLDGTLLYLSEYYEAELDETTRNMVSLLEPLMMVSMGGIVGFITISILLPIYSISSTLGG